MGTGINCEVVVLKGERHEALALEPRGARQTYLWAWGPPTTDKEQAHRTCPDPPAFLSPCPMPPLPHDDTGCSWHPPARVLPEPCLNLNLGAPKLDLVGAVKSKRRHVPAQCIAASLASSLRSSSSRWPKTDRSQSSS